MVTNRDTARATTPSAVPNGANVSSSPWATAAGHRCGYPRGGDDLRQQLEPTPDAGIAPRASQPVAVGQIGGRQRMQPRERLQRGPLPHTDQRRRSALQRLRHPQRSGQHRVGVTGFGQLQRAAVEHRGRPGGTQRRLRGGRRPSAQVGAVPVRPPQRLAGLLTGRRHAGKVNQRRERDRRDSSRQHTLAHPVHRWTRHPRRSALAIRRPQRPCEVPTPMQR